MAAHHKLLAHPTALCNIVRRIALEAGEITLKYYDMADVGQLSDKSDGSPVTLADQEAEAFIQKSLSDILPDVPMIGEERAAAGEDEIFDSQSYYWCVDPLDGTKEFIGGGEEFTVNIALIHQTQPVLGVVYIPVTGILYAGYGDVAIRWSEETKTEKPISVRPPPARGVTVVASKSHGDKGKLDTFLEGFKVAKTIQKGSSLKICTIAEGKADLYPRFGPTCHWDTAAAHAVLKAAGGDMTDINGVSLTYDPAVPGFYNPEFIASSFVWHEAE